MAGSLTVVAVGSRNPAKTLGARKAFSRYFTDLEVRGVDATLAVRVQPLTLEETIEGAVARARLAIQASGEADFGVGVEAGLTAFGDESLNLQVAAIMDRRGRHTLGSSSGFMVPGTVVRQMQVGGVELDRFAKGLAGSGEVREEDGVVYHLTRGAVSRVDMTAECVGMALVPWINRDIYLL
ncbi:MAG: inosine/xanthosine triphosphatase [Nitrososphaerota archaeon]|jgi:inosine/xanthosine triphosphatase|nr:inosine/xanthosine triphosphatase [Nitrososphaerota archaeon]MDG6977470.1 inosine/xanthosine triphosphatase [Nitrososphaerota archaeon]MDG7022402.1 inosine/xanthosine triphosphatase [Nitrososphaerota archaeon]